jgi:hypothetical protein
MAICKVCVQSLFIDLWNPIIFIYLKIYTRVAPTELENIFTCYLQTCRPYRGFQIPSCFKEDNGEVRIKTRA